MRWYNTLMAKEEVAKVHEPFDEFIAGFSKPKVTLYGNPLSQPSRTLEALLKLAKIEFEFVNVDFTELKSEWYLKVNPLGQIPAVKI
jgi:hypothetical protein